jgi:hypothetical protein
MLPVTTLERKPDPLAGTATWIECATSRLLRRVALLKRHMRLRRCGQADRLAKGRVTSVGDHSDTREPDSSGTRPQRRRFADSHVPPKLRGQVYDILTAIGLCLDQRFAFLTIPSFGARGSTTTSFDANDR